VTIRLFAGLRDRAGAGELSLELPDGARVADALAQLTTLTEGVSVVMAVNREYAEEGRTLAAGDELALIPPVSGGSAQADASTPRVHVQITAEPLALDPLILRVRDPRAGAVVTFSGVTREVDHLDYEAYVAMALAQMRQIAAAAVDRHGLCAAAAEHRVGAVALGEPSLLIAVSAPHRGGAFAGAREIIDEIKARAPIWKHEAGEWVAGTTPTPRPPDPADR
jgi:molybdopterin synthase catalytic subunit/molybdopterin converting factor small subunit